MKQVKETSEMKIKPHKCPRCGATVYFTSKEYFENGRSRPFLVCPECYVPYKINLDGHNRIVSVERLKEQVNLEITIIQPDDKWVVYETSMSDASYNSLIAIIKLLRLGEQKAKPSTLSLVQTLVGDTMSAMFWDQRNKLTSEYAVNQAVPNLERLYNDYPSQVTYILNKQGLGRYLYPLSILCQKCSRYIPRSRIINCPFCKRENKTEKEKGEEPLKILKLRYAKGEITKEQYEEMKKTLELP